MFPTTICYGVLYVDFSVLVKMGRLLSTSHLFLTDLKEEQQLVHVKLSFKMVGYFHIFFLVAYLKFLERLKFTTLLMEKECFSFQVDDATSWITLFFFTN